MSIIAEMKQVQRQFNDFSNFLSNNSFKVINQASSQGAQQTTKQSIIDLNQHMEGVWNKAERVNTEMIRAFSQLIGK